MNKKTILFIGLMVCFLGVLAYVENIEKQKQTELEQAELEQAELKQTEISGAKEEINWDNITPEYFLTEDIFDTDARTDLSKFNVSEDETTDSMFARYWYNENDYPHHPFLTVAIIKNKEKLVEDKARYDCYEEGEIVIKLDNMIRTYVGSFAFQDEIIAEHKVETKKEQIIETEFRLDWLENKFSFIIKTTEQEYQDDIKEVAKNIINKYPNQQ